MDFIVRHWQDLDDNSGWGYGRSPSNYQSMFCLMRGLEYSRFHLIDLDGDGTPEYDWYQEFAKAIVDQQHEGGYWEELKYGEKVLDTAWALLTLEMFLPTKFYLSIKTEPIGITTISGEGWYDSGTSVTTGMANATVSWVTGTRYAFQEWMIDGNYQLGNPVSTIMNSSHEAVAKYITQHYLMVISDTIMNCPKELNCSPLAAHSLHPQEPIDEERGDKN